VIGPGDAPDGWRVEHVLRLTAPDGSTIDVVKDDGSPAEDWDEVVELLRRAHGTAVRREAIRRRRRELRRQRRDQDDRLAG
jgi:hypothetical protein